MNSSPGGHSSDPEIMRQFYSQVDPEVISRIAEIYHIDFQLFGFSNKSVAAALNKWYWLKNRKDLMLRSSQKDYK